MNPEPIAPSAASLSMECGSNPASCRNVADAKNINPTQSIMDDHEINQAAQDAALKILPEAAKRIHSPWPEFMQLLADVFKQGVDFARNTYKPSN